MFTILVRFLNGTTCVNEVPLLFNWNTTQWQKVAGAAKATGDYASVQFVICYYNNNNSAYFDNAQLIKDTFGSTYTYDSDGNLISTVDLQGKEEYTFQYDGNNQLIKETSVSGSEINYTYTDQKSLASVSAGGVKTEYTYDSFGNVIETDTHNEDDDTLYMGATATYSTNGDYLTKVTDVRYNSVNYEYNQQRGYLTSETNAWNIKTQYEYNASELISKIRVGMVGGRTFETNYQYTESNKLSSITSMSQTVYNFTYDNFGRNNSIKVGNRLLSNYSYTNQGLLTGATYGNGTTISYTYDDLNREKETWINNVLRYKKSYDGDSRVSEVVDVLAAQKYKYDYDILGRYVGEQLVSESTQAGVTTESTQAKLRVRYDDTKNRVAGYDSDIEGNIKSTDYVYGEVAKAPDMINGVRHNGTRVLSYAYDGLNRLQSRTLHTTTPVVTEYGYWEGIKDNTTTAMVKYIRKGNDVFEYIYDRVGNIQAINKNGEKYEYYQYNILNQLTIVEDPQVVYEYLYDDYGNLITVNEIDTDLTVIKTYTYGDSEWKDLLTAYNNQTITYDAIGNPLTYINGRTFTWTDGRKLATVSQGDNNIAYTYDVNGLRNSKTVNNNTTTYYWLNGSLEGQKTGEEYLFFLYDETGTIYGFVVKNGTQETTYYYDFNLQGDVVAIIDTAGTKVVEYSYDVWGVPRTVTGTMADTIGQKNPIRYRGYYYDAETGFYYLQNRYYDPEIGRFINADGALYSDNILGYNLFLYCNNNPINFYDPNGEDAMSIVNWIYTIGAVIATVEPTVIGEIIFIGAFAVGAYYTVKQNNNKNDLVKAIEETSKTTDKTKDKKDNKKNKNDKDSRLIGEPGQINKEGNKETLIGPDGRAIKERHWTDHGRPKYHTNPHDHNISWDANGNPIFDEPQNYWDGIIPVFP